MNKPTKPNITIPESFAANGVKVDFDNNKILNGFDRIQPDVLAGDNLNKFIDDTYKGLNYGIKGVDYLEERWKSQVTNCITEIPQRIKLELNNETLTLKAGSVVIVPYGTEDLTATYPVGVTFLNDNFKVYDTQFTDGKFFVWAELVSDISYISGITTSAIDRFITISVTGNNINTHIASVSGGAPVATSTYTLSYNTNTNLLGFSGNDTNLNYDYVTAFPIMNAKSAVNGYLVTSINQVFNGMGYIGATLWVDKGVKGFASNGKNADGSLNNIEVTSNSLFVRDIKSAYSAAQKILFFHDAYDLGDTADTTLQSGARYLEGPSSGKPTTLPNTYSWMYYATDENIYYFSYGSTTAKWNKVELMPLSSQYFDGTNITSFNPKQPFRAVDYNDKPDISSWSMPSNEHIYLTLGASNSSYTAPANGWFCIAGASSSTTSWVQFQNTSAEIGSMAWNTAANNGLKCFVPAKKGDTITIQYYNLKDATLRFIYAKGEV